MTVRRQPPDPPVGGGDEVSFPVDVCDLDLAWVEATCEQWLVALGAGRDMVAAGDVIDVMLDIRTATRRARGRT